MFEREKFKSVKKLNLLLTQDVPAAQVNVVGNSVVANDLDGSCQVTEGSKSSRESSAEKVNALDYLKFFSVCVLLITYRFSCALNVHPFSWRKAVVNLHCFSFIL